MSTDANTVDELDYVRIQNVITRGLVARDAGDWVELADCYHPDATLTTSWFNGSPAEFVQGSQNMKITRHEGESQLHMTGNHHIRIHGSRSIAECDLILYQRRTIEGVELDFATWSKRLHLVEKRSNQWRILQQTVIYEKDRVDPARPDGVPAGFFSRFDFSKYPPQIRFHCWRNDVIGFPPPKNICIKGSDREKDVRRKAETWLQTGLR